MRIAVIGLWHLGTVTAACLASAGHDVVAIDDDAAVIEGLENGIVPVEEPGLPELITKERQSGRLRFCSDEAAVSEAEVVWIAYDTPVDENDVGDYESVIEWCVALFPFLRHDAIMLVSSQLPVGSLAAIEKRYRSFSHAGQVRFACAPENLRLGRSVDIFLNPDRVVVGVRSPEDKSRLAPIWAPFASKIEWMSVESAETTKHAINAFLATSVAFINEIARICEVVDADAMEVERGLKSDSRIGHRAYLHPGPAFGGGTLARDLGFLANVACRHGVRTPLIEGIKLSNQEHQSWLQGGFMRWVGEATGKRVAVLGLTYKPGTSALRRSKALDVCRWLLSEGASVIAYDPTVTGRHAGIPEAVQLAETAEEVLDGADALLITTEWPQFRQLSGDDMVSRMKSAVVIDPSAHLKAVVGSDRRIRYYCIGTRS